MAECGNKFVLWMVDQLKMFLREQLIPLSGSKVKLMKKVADIFTTDSLENEIERQYHLNQWSTPPHLTSMTSQGLDGLLKAFL